MVWRLYDRSDVRQRPPRSPQQQRNRKRWAVVAGVAALWAFFAYSTSVVAGTVLLLLLAVAVILLMVALRCLGINRDHPWVQRLAAWPWRDVADPVVPPGGYRPEPGMPEPVRSQPVRPAGAQPADSFYVQAPGGHAYGDPDRFGPPYSAPAAHDPAGVGPVYAAPAAHDPAGVGPVYAAPAANDPARVDPAAAQTVVSEFATVVALKPVPPLRLVTNGNVTETRVSGARAGRSREAELRLPEEPTVSRAHAEFTFTDGRWHITNLGLNGVTLNGTPVTGEHAISNGDSIGWGTQPGALASRVEIGWDMARQAGGQR
jgi:hypothetical protein